MSHNAHVVDGVNKDVGIMSYAEAKDYYLEMAEGWVDPYGDPVVVEHGGIRVVRDDLITGTKCRGGDLLLNRLPIQYEKIVYVQPRVGLAGVSILSAAKRYDKDVVLHMPASRRISQHQAVCIERGATPLFTRIAAMPNLNKVAAEWASDRDDAFFVPLGLKHPLVTAALVATANKIPEPEVVVVATSTGVLSRALQIAWPKAAFYSVCVSRNMKAGELGRAHPISEPLEFLTPEKEENLPPFPSVRTYDAKAWKTALEIKELWDGSDVLFWNVGKEPELKDPTIIDRVNSQRDWSTKAT